MRRAAPTLLAAGLALAYVLISPPSLDLVAHLLRAKLFGAEGFGLWNNWWYAGHHVPGYSVLFPPLAWLLTPQLAAALACVGTAAAFEALAFDRFGPDAWLGSLWFGAATASDLFTGRLTFAFGLLPAVLSALALERRRPAAATTLAVLTALASPVAALFVALAAAAYALGPLAARTRPAARRLLTGATVAIGALLPVAVLAVAFPEGGTEPFALNSMWPVLLVCAAAVVLFPARERVLRVGALLYLVGTLGSYLVASPVGGNAVRLAALVAGPLVAMLWLRPRPRWLALVALPLLYLQWQPAVRDVINASGDPSEQAAYDAPLLRFLHRQAGAGVVDFRVEIPFTRFHTEVLRVAPQFPTARGWERQLDIADNALFYNGTLSPATYHAWLRQLAVRFVAVSDAPLDYSSHGEARLIAAGLPYLRPVFTDRHWHVYRVSDATPLLSGTGARLTATGPNSFDLDATRPGTVLLRVRFTPYWRLAGVPGCVERSADGFTTIALRGTGTARLVIDFALDRVGARSPRCSSH
jgi:hypothetical protein